jgi:PHD/YefM family antitoxin component YafN of YafNO toxin-antitoxin module
VTVQLSVTITVTTSDHQRYVITDHPHPDVINIVEEEYDAYNRKWEEVGYLRTISVRNLETIYDAVKKVKEIRDSTTTEE